MCIGELQRPGRGGGSRQCGCLQCVHRLYMAVAAWDWVSDALGKRMHTHTHTHNFHCTSTLLKQCVAPYCYVCSKQAMEELVYRTARGMAAEGAPFVGTLFAGLMIKDGKVCLCVCAGLRDSRNQPAKQ